LQNSTLRHIRDRRTAEAHEEIIGIRVVEHRGGIEWSWKALYDQPHRGIGEFPIHMLEAGAKLTVAVNGSLRPCHRD